MGFTDEEFSKAQKELDAPDLRGYEFFVESHGVKVHRCYSEESGLYQYKVLGSIAVEPEVCFDVYMDLAYRKTWDTYATELSCISKGEMEVVYWEVAYPWPMSHRDYVYIRQSRVFCSERGKTWVVLGRAATTHDLEGSGSFPEKSGVIRVDDFIQGIVITSDGKGGTKAFMHYYDNPKGSIPAWLINWAARSGVPDFLSKMEDACKGYNKSVQ